MKERFWPDDIDLGPDECWEWQAGKYSNGYGQFGIGHRKIGAHRVAWWLVNGQEPSSDVMVLHRCDNRGCCNPKHLFLGDNFTNMQDCAKKGRMVQQKNPSLWRKGEAHGRATITEDQVLDIRAYFNQDCQVADIAMFMSIPYMTVYRVAHRQSWKHLS